MEKLSFLHLFPFHPFLKLISDGYHGLCIILSIIFLDAVLLDLQCIMMKDFGLFVHMIGF